MPLQLLAVSIVIHVDSPVPIIENAVAYNPLQLAAPAMHLCLLFLYHERHVLLQLEQADEGRNRKKWLPTNQGKALA